MAENESGQNYKEVRRIWRPAEEQMASNCFLWDSTLPAAAHFRWLLSPTFIISTSLNTGSCWHEHDNTSSMIFFVHISPLSLFVLFRHAWHRWTESTDVFFLSLSFFLFTLFPFFLFLFLISFLMLLFFLSFFFSRGLDLGCNIIWIHIRTVTQWSMLVTGVWFLCSRSVTSEIYSNTVKYYYNKKYIIFYFNIL